MAAAIFVDVPWLERCGAAPVIVQAQRHLDHGAMPPAQQSNQRRVAALTCAECVPWRCVTGLASVARDSSEVYLYVPKAASTTNKILLLRHGAVEMASTTWAQAVEMARWPHGRGFSQNASAAVTLTFTRDPVARFVSAVAEVALRANWSFREEHRARWNHVPRELASCVGQGSMLTSIECAIRYSEVRTLCATSSRAPRAHIPGSPWTRPAAHRALCSPLLSSCSSAAPLLLLAGLSLLPQEHNTWWNVHIAPQVAYFARPVFGGNDSTATIAQPQPVLALPMDEGNDAIARGWRLAAQLLPPSGVASALAEHADRLPKANAGNAAKPALDAALTRRLCSLYRLDYLCLRLPAPAECASVLGLGLNTLLREPAYLKPL